MAMVVGQVENPAGEMILFVNGVENTRESANASGEMVSEAFGGRQVTVIHNPTRAMQFIRHEDGENVTNVAAQVAEAINGFFNEGTTRSIKLFVHSHGAVVANRALQSLEDNVKGVLSIYAFAGATMLRQDQGNDVRNYVSDQDLVASMGNMRDRQDLALYRTQRIIKRMTDGGIDRNTAIRRQAGEETFHELCPIARAGRLENHATILAKNQRFQRIFTDCVEGALDADPFFQEKVQQYQQLFTDYDIRILQGIDRDEPEYEPVVGSFSQRMGARLRNAMTALVSAGSHTLANHRFEAYETIIEAIAAEHGIGLEEAE